MFFFVADLFIYIIIVVFRYIIIINTKLTFKYFHGNSKKKYSGSNFFFKLTCL